MARKGKAPAERSYARLTRHERNSLERMLDRGEGARAIAAELGRSPSTVANEVARRRFAAAPRSMYGEPAPADLTGACGRVRARAGVAQVPRRVQAQARVRPRQEAARLLQRQDGAGRGGRGAQGERAR